MWPDPRVTLNFLYKALGHYNKNMGCDINYDEFCDGYNIYGWYLDHHHSRDYLPVTKLGNTSIQITFDKPLPHAVMLIVYGCFTNAMLIDQSRRIRV